MLIMVLGLFSHLTLVCGLLSRFYRCSPLCCFTLQKTLSDKDLVIVEKGADMVETHIASPKHGRAADTMLQDEQIARARERISFLRAQISPADVTQISSG